MGRLLCVKRDVSREMFWCLRFQRAVLWPGWNRGRSTPALWECSARDHPLAPLVGILGLLVGGVGFERCSIFFAILVDICQGLWYNRVS